MYNVDAPPASQLPSSRALLRSTLIAVAVAMVLLVAVVLPAEYGVDPTGIGRIIGLTEMGEIKMALAEEAAATDSAEAAAAAGNVAAVSPPAAAAPSATTDQPPADRSAVSSDEVSLALAPGEGREIKLAMREGARVNFTWTVQGGVVNFDTHADRPGLSYHGYEKGTAQPSDEGVLVAAFDGMHGWFWRNRGDAPVTVTLRTSGDYQELREIK